ncbi:MAG: hypothetical protein JNL34_16815 [Anaerolineae bacterium]|nr:hypothetical protein [Anaerolineae bacterium]
MTIYDDAAALAEKLSSTDKVRLIERLSLLLRRDLVTDDWVHLPWADFVQRTAGSLADDPVERPPQLPFEDREPIP